MKLGICTISFGPVGLKQAIESAAELGFEHVELTCNSHIFPADPVSRRNEIRNCLKENGLYCSSIHSVFHVPNDFHHDRSHAMATFHSVIDLAADFGAANIVMGSNTTGGLWPRDVIEGRAGCMAEVLHDACEYAAKAGTRIGFEPINRFQNSAIRRLEDARALAEACGLGNHPAAGITADTFHMHHEEINLVDAFRTHMQWISHVHLADSNRMPPGAGNMDFYLLLKTLAQCGYRGTLSIECLGLGPGERYINDAARAKAMMASGKKHIDDILATLREEHIL